MSYILESLKKSEQERQSSNESEGLGVSGVFSDHIAFINSYEERKKHKIAIVGLIFFIVFFVGIYFISFNKNSGESQQNSSFDKKELAEKVLPRIIPVDSEPVVIDTKSPPQVISIEKEQKQKNEIGNIPPAIVSESRSLSDDDSVLSHNNALASIPVDINNSDVESLYELDENKHESLESIANSSIVDASVLSVEDKEDEPVEAREAISTIYQLNRTFQEKIPAINYGAHIYSVNNDQGFVILNGAKLNIGEKMSNGIYVEKVRENDVVLSFKGQLFSLPSMKNWSP